MPKGIPNNGINNGRFKKGGVSPRKGVLVTEVTRLKMRNNKLGRKVVFSDKHKEKLSLSSRGKSKPWLKGVSRITPEMRIKMSEGIRKKWEDRTKLKKREDRKSQSYIDWRKKVRARDGYKCKMSNEDCCGILEAHHILSWKDFPELRYEVDNGIILCKYHHPRKRSDAKNLISYFVNLIKNI